MDAKTDLENFRLAAEQLKMTYDELKRAGFTEKEAFELLKTFITEVIKKGQLKGNEKRD